MADPWLLGFAIGPFMVGSFAVAAMLIGCAFCAARGRHDHLFSVSRLFAVTSGLTALYLFCESAVYTAMLLDENDWATYIYRIMIAVALPAGTGYWLLARRILTRHPTDGDGRVPTLVAGIAALTALATLIPAPYGLLGPIVVDIDNARVGPRTGAGAVVYGIVASAILIYLIATLLRGLIVRRRARWPLFRIAGLIGCFTAFHDLLRMLDTPIARMPLLWAGLGLMLGVTFVVLARQYAGLTVQVEGRENEISRLRAEQIADPASGTFSRRMLESLLRKEVGRLARGHTPGSGVLLLRLDNFEQIRSRLGASSAEAVMGDLAELLQGSVRESDSIGRWAPDCFIILVHTPDADLAQRVIGRIETATDLRHYEPMAGLELGLSTGYAQLGPDPDESWQQAVRKAEQAAGLRLASGG